jgi:hypothetical protein
MTRCLSAAVAAALVAVSASAQTAAWSGHGGNPQHTALSPTATQPLQAVRWQTPVDLNPQYTGNGNLLIHYGSPTITAANTVVVPVKTGATDGFRVEGRSGATGALLWTQPTDYTLPTANWKPSYSPTIAPGNTLYYAGAGGTIYKRDNLDAAGAVTPTQLAFYGAGGNAADLGTYLGDRDDFNANVSVSTPITSDAAGNIYFGYQVRDPSAVGNLQSGFAKITPGGVATYTSADSLAPAGDATIRGVAINCAPAVSADGSRVYVAITTSNGSPSGNGYLVALNASSLAVTSRVDLRDVRTPTNRAVLSNSGTASPTIGPDGDVFIGVLENPNNTSRGWMLQFNADLSQSQTPGAFGWDITPSVIPRSMVPSYQGASEYLLMTKYNNYAGRGGDGVNKLAILDPNDTQVDARTGATVMKEVLSIAGVTPDHEYIATHPNAVREWCINTAAIDPATNSVLANSADGKLYRWDLTTNTFTEVVALTQGIGEAYTPTVIGPDGTVYAINNATLYAVGVPVPEPTAVLGLAAGGLGLAAGARRLCRRRGASQG